MTTGQSQPGGMNHQPKSLSMNPMGSLIVNIGPADADFTLGGLQFVDEVKGGNIPKEFIPPSTKVTFNESNG